MPNEHSPLFPPACSCQTPFYFLSIILDTTSIQKNVYFCFIDYVKAFDMDQNKLQILKF